LGIKPEEIMFPHEKIREVQSELIQEIGSCIKNKKNLIVHAPTGLGKTAASIAPALSYALKNKLTVFFLTSRHTQHKIAVETLKKIKERYNADFTAVDLIGKKHMCPVPGIDALYSFDFAEYCKQQREEGLCEFYENLKSRSKLSSRTISTLKKLKERTPCDVEEIIELCKKERLCPYEISMIMAKEANVIITDYYYIFNNSIRDAFFKKADKELENSIIIIDEGHNLPKRIIDLLTQKISTVNLNRAIKEARKYRMDEAAVYLKSIKDALHELAEGIDEKKQEKMVEKDAFLEKIKQIGDYETLTSSLEFAAKEIREQQKQSYLGAVANFLLAWQGDDEVYARILSSKETKTTPLLSLLYKCLDPGILTKDIINKAYSTIMMSGTLTPTSMYQEILGFDKTRTIEKEFPSPFPIKNKLNLIIPETTTRFTKRGQEEYKRIANIVARIINITPGNSAVFFPSYQLRDDIFKHIDPLCKKTIFLERSDLSKAEKEELLERFKSYKEIGAALLAVASANFAEGIDLPDILKAVIIVGLPLQKPNLETTKLIEYYDKKFGKGWDYGYIFPAITKCLQSAGRCIRSETDRGVIIFLDERFAWENYKKCFSPDMRFKITKLYEERINEFFSLKL
jgi:DNA excision repair protein ERCC-2